LKAIEELGGRFHKLFVDVQIQSLRTGREVPVAITLRSRKVYVGSVLEAPRIEAEEKFLVLLPFLSGYRDKDSLEVEFTSTYWDAYEALERDSLADRIPEFALVIPVAEIVTANRFDIDFYERFFSEEGRMDEDPESLSEGTPAAPPGAEHTLVTLLIELTKALLPILFILQMFRARPLSSDRFASPDKRD
jgi:hypothetical protein